MGKSCFAYFEMRVRLFGWAIPALLRPFVSTVDFESLSLGRACADVPTLGVLDVGDVGVAVLVPLTGVPAPALDVFDAGMVGVPVLVLRTGVPARALDDAGGATREPLFSRPERAASFVSASCGSALIDVVLPRMGALATVTGFLEVCTREVLLKPSASKL